MEKLRIWRRILCLLLVMSLVFAQLPDGYVVYADDSTESSDEDGTEDTSTQETDTETEDTSTDGTDTETEEHVHQYEAVTTEPTCTDDGLTTYTCSGCGDTYEEVIQATGHNYNGNVCTNCGAVIESDISAGTITLSYESCTYNGSARKPTVTVVINETELTSGTDYTVTYSNNTDAGTATVTITGTGSYTGTVTKYFTIKQKSVSSATVTLSTTSYTYNGSSRKPTPTVKLTLNGKSTKLTKTTDYTVSYKNNKSAGTATVTITGTGNFKGTVKATFTIKQKSISSATVTLSTSSYTYSGKAKKPTPTVKISLNGSTKKLTKGTDYTVSYSNNTSVGKATVKITGTGNYKGTVTATFKINPKSTKLSSLSAVSKGFTAKWSTVSGVSGYQIQYATNSSFTKNKGTVTISGKSKKTSTITSVKASMKYYVRIRTYKTVNGTKYYSSWSSAKTVTTKSRVTVFAGDSIMSGLLASSYNGVSYMDISGSEKVVAYTGLNTQTFQTTSCFSGKTGIEKVISYQPYRLYIMLGTNEVEWRSVSKTIAYYEEIIEEIQSESPATDIVILSVPPVTSSIASSRTGFKKISTLNTKLEALAEEYDCKYYDFTASFKNSSGYLLSKYNSGDGIHWNKAGYKLFAKIISAYDDELEG